MIVATMTRGTALNLIRRHRNGKPVGAIVFAKAQAVLHRAQGAAPAVRAGARARKRGAAVQPRASHRENGMTGKGRRDVRLIVFEAMEKLGEATAVQIHEAVWRSGLSLTQVQSCVYNCQSEGHMTSVRRAATGVRASGPPEAVYRLTGADPTPRARTLRKKPEKRKGRGQYASVFHYAQGIEAGDRN